jgi:hypothetical protein
MKEKAAPPSTAAKLHDRAREDSLELWGLCNAGHDSLAASIIRKSRIYEPSITTGWNTPSSAVPLDQYLIIPAFYPPSNLERNSIILLIFARQLSRCTEWAGARVSSATWESFVNSRGETPWSLSAAANFTPGITRLGNAACPDHVMSSAMNTAIAHGHFEAFHRLEDNFRRNTRREAGSMGMAREVMNLLSVSPFQKPMESLAGVLMSTPAIADPVGLWTGLVRSEGIEDLSRGNGWGSLAFLMIEILGRLRPHSTNWAMVEYLLMHEGIFETIWINYLSMTKDMRNHGDYSEDTPHLFSIYAREGFTEMLGLLLNKAIPHIIRVKHPKMGAGEIDDVILKELGTRDRTGLAPLECSVVCNMPDTVACIIAKLEEANEGRGYKSVEANIKVVGVYSALHRSVSGSHRPTDCLEMLLRIRGLNINDHSIWNLSMCGTVLSTAAFNSNIPAVEKLLAEPKIDINAGNYSENMDPTKTSGLSPFSLAVMWGKTPIIKILLARPELDPNIDRRCYPIFPRHVSEGPGDDTETNKKLEIYRLLLEDGRWDPRRQIFHDKWAWRVNHVHIHLLLDDPRFREVLSTSPLVWDHAASLIDRKDDTRLMATMAVSLQWAVVSREMARLAIGEGEARLRGVNHLSLEGFLSANPEFREKRRQRLWGLVICLSDGLLWISQREGIFPAPDEAKQDAARFFSIVSRMPLELQMIITNRAAGISKDRITSSEAENGAKWVARLYAHLEKIRGLGQVVDE